MTWEPDEDGIRKDCMLAARDLLGSGYTPDYYRGCAADFVNIALATAREGYEAGLRDAAERRVELPITRRMLRGLAGEVAGTALLLRRLRDEEGLPQELIDETLDTGRRVIQALAEVDAAEGMTT